MTTQPAGGRTCPECGAAIQPGQAICHECGAELRQKSTQVRCRHCGHRASSALVICPHCGRELKPAPSRLLTWGAPAALVIVFVAVLASRGMSAPQNWLQGLGPQVTVVEAPTENPQMTPVVAAVQEVAVAPATPEPPTPTQAPPTSTPASSEQGQAAAADTPTPVPTDTPAPTNTPTATATATPVPPTATPTQQATATPSPTRRPPNAATIRAMAADAATATPTRTPSPRATATPTATPRSTATPTPTRTPSPRATATPTVTAAATSSTENEYSAYTVRVGDTFVGIAVRYGVTVDELLAINNMTEAQASQLRPGQVLRVPGGGDISYTVQPGDTLVGIALRFNVSTEALMQANGLTVEEARTIRPGQVLEIPSEGAQPFTAPQPTRPPTATPTPEMQRYTVQPGDTVIGIARRFNVTWGNLLAANGLTAEEARTIRPGYVLLIPRPGQVFPTPTPAP